MADEISRLAAIIREIVKLTSDMGLGLWPAVQGCKPLDAVLCGIVGKFCVVDCSDGCHEVRQAGQLIAGCTSLHASWPANQE